MQKKLYFLDESEKNRILNLHESRTQNQYLLNEQIYDFTTNRNVDDPKMITIKTFMNSVVSQKGKLSDFFQKFPTREPNVYKSLPETTKTSIKDWPKYNCVINSLNVKPFLTKDFSIAFVGGGFNWFANGRKGNITSGEIVSYYCSPDGKVVSGTPGVGVGNVQSVAGGSVLPNVVTPQVVTQLRKDAGLTDTATTLTQKDINDLYAMFYHQLPKK